MNARRISVAILTVLTITAQAQGVSGIPTGDIGNYVQNSVTAQESVAQTLKQIEQHRTQLDQYALQIKNATAPSAYVWDQAVRTMEQLRGAMDTLAYYKRQLGSTDAFLRQFNDVNDYRASPCFTGGGCSGVERTRLMERDRFMSEAQKKANEDAVRTLDQQQAAMATDAQRLQQLQTGAQGAQGQMEAIGYANMLAGQQSNQLLQMRALMAAQHAALTTRMQAQADREAREGAAGEAFRAGAFVSSPKRGW